MSGKTVGVKLFGSPFKTTGLAVRGHYWQKVTAGLALTVLFSLKHVTLAADSQASQFTCSADHCGLLVDGAYPNLVIGRLAHVGTPADMNRAFRWAKTHGYWKSLPNAVAPYLRDVQLVTIAATDASAGKPVTLFMLKSEFASAPYHVGDLVRYAPHDAAHDEAATGDADDLALFHGLTGCVAVLCQPGDDACHARYRHGAFTPAQGRQVSLANGHVVPGGARIDPVSLLPLH